MREHVSSERIDKLPKIQSSVVQYLQILSYLLVTEDEERLVIQLWMRRKKEGGRPAFSVIVEERWLGENY